MMHAIIATQTRTRLLSLAATVALIATACGGGAETNAGDQAAVTVGGVESGCAAAINLSKLFNGEEDSTMTADGMRQLAASAASLNGSFDDPPSDVTTYIELVEGVVGRAADAAEAQDNPTARQIMLLLDFEMAGREADFERLTPEADAFFSSECGTAYSKFMSGSESTATTAAVADTIAPDPTTDTVAAAALDADGNDDAQDEPAAPAVELIVEDTSMGATGVYRSLEIEVGEIIRTNLTPDSALNGGSEFGDGNIIMVEVRLANNGIGYLYAPLSGYSWASSDGIRMDASEAVAATGAEWNGQVDDNEAKRGYFVFPADVGVTDGAYLQVGGGDHVAERIPLGAGAASSAYPIEIPSGQTGSGILTNGSSTDCEYPTNFEVRGANATLDAFGNVEIIRPATNERFITVQLAVKVESVTGQSCDWATTVYGNLTDIRLQLDNGDIVGPTAPDFRAEVDTTEVVTLSFPVPASTTAFDLIVADNAPIASWTDIALPEA